MNHVMRKQRRRSADQRLCFHYTDITICLFSIFKHFKSPAIFSECTDRFVSDLVGTPEDRFSRVAAQIQEIKIKLTSFKSSEHINEKGDGPYRGFGYLSLFSDPIDLATWSQRELL